MKNLTLLSSKSFSSNDLCHATKMCIDSESKCAYFVSGCNKVDGFSLYCIEEAKNTITTITTKPIVEEDGDSQLKNRENVVISFDYILEQQKLCLVYSFGDIVMCDPLTKTFEILGSVESGIINAGWSPDQGLLVVLTRDDTFILMTSNFDPLVEKDLYPTEFGESEPINVGWGSKETQFHGSEGKTAAKIKEKDVEPALEWDDSLPRVSWQSDGEFFVISAVEPSLGCRVLRIWDHDGHLQYTSEIKTGLEHPLCWGFTNNLITSTRQHPNKHEVVFFEKNGLQFSEFVLPYKPDSFRVTEVLWDFDRKLLAVWGQEKIDDETGGNYHVLLWSMKNYFWYLKQRLDFGPLRIKNVLWDPWQPNHLHVSCDKGQYFQYNWEWTHHFSNASTGTDDVSIAVIADDSILITPFRKMIVPPPMSAYTLKMPCSVNCIAFAPRNQSEDFVAILSDGQIALCTKGPSADPFPNNCSMSLTAAGGKGFSSKAAPHTTIGLFRINVEGSNLDLFRQNPLLFNHWTWVANNKLLCTSSPGSFLNDKDGDHRSSALFSIDLPINGYQEKTLLDINLIDRIKNNVIGMCANEDGTVVAIQLNSGKILKYENAPYGKISPWLSLEGKELCFPTPCPQFSIHSIEGKMVLLGLSERSYLYCNDVAIVTKCTSYFIHDEYLLISTYENYLKCYRKNRLLKINANQVELVEDCSQPLEAGAKIVVAIPLDTKLILQMPRGNLELIHPRPLVLSSICRSLDGGEFSKAFMIAKRQRINLNILYDHNPKIFIENVGTFIEQIKSPNDLNLFITSLQNEDVSQSMYAFTYTRERPTRNSKDNKIDVICDSLRNVLEKQNSDKYIQTIIATYAQKSKPEIQKALTKIKAIQNSAEGGEVAEEALRFLLYLVNVSELYNIALGTYDFEIAVMVAEKSNMDPKEYLPFLNNLQEMEENYRKYKIDMHLQRYKQALVNISQCADHFDECISLIKAQRLYSNALFIFHPTSDHFQAVWNVYGDYLMEKMYYNEAGMVYSKAGNHQKALQAFQESGDWRLALCSAHTLGYTTKKISILCENIAGRLKGNHRYEESAHLLEYYVKDVEESIATLIEGQLWESALNLMTNHNRLDIAETHLKPALQEHHQHLYTLIDTSLANFIKYFERLKVVKREKELASTENDGHTYPDDDLFSETSSVSSVSASSKVSKQFSGSLVTKKSSRSRKKQELKKYRLKEGSPDEDLALLAELSEIVNKIDKLKDNLFSFLRISVKFDFINEGKLLQQKMKEIHEKIDKDLPNIVYSANAPTADQDMRFGPASTANSISASMQQTQKSLLSTSDLSSVKFTWRKNMNIYLHCLDS